MRVVLDTNVIVSALRSLHGASFRVLRLTGTRRFEFAISVPLVLEYEAALAQVPAEILDPMIASDVLDHLCQTGVRVQPRFAWRPSLSDPADEHVLELAVSGRCESIVTYNRSDFSAASAFGIAIWSPAELLRRIGDEPWAL
jgi:predicted nucleic acid-binding protein